MQIFTRRGGDPADDPTGAHSHKHCKKRTTVSEALQLLTRAGVTPKVAPPGQICTTGVTRKRPFRKPVQILTRRGGDPADDPTGAHLHKEFNKRTTVSKAPSDSHPDGGDSNDGTT